MIFAGNFLTIHHSVNLATIDSHHNKRLFLISIFTQTGEKAKQQLVKTKCKTINV